MYLNGFPAVTACFGSLWTMFGFKFLGPYSISSWFVVSSGVRGVVGDSLMWRSVEMSIGSGSVS